MFVNRLSVDRIENFIDETQSGHRRHLNPHFTTLRGRYQRAKEAYRLNEELVAEFVIVRDQLQEAERMLFALKQQRQVTKAGDLQ